MKATLNPSRKQIRLEFFRTEERIVALRITEKKGPSTNGSPNSPEEDNFQKKLLSGGSSSGLLNRSEPPSKHRRTPLVFWHRPERPIKSGAKAIY